MFTFAINKFISYETIKNQFTYLNRIIILM